MSLWSGDGMAGRSTISIETLMSLYEVHGTLDAVAAIVGRDRATVHERLQRAGYKQRGVDFYSQEEKAEVIRFYTETPPNEFNLDIRWSTVSQKTVTALFRFINIQYEGDINTPLGYEMLEALQPGRNITWTVNWVQKLFNGLQLTVSYEGRGSQGKQFVHIGRMQLAALF
jgi:hypothetical protein